MSERYAMFKNFMHNELGITKQDIKDWTMESVKQVAEHYVKKEISQYTGEAILKKAIYNSWGSSLNEDIKRTIGKIISENIELKFKK